MDTRKSGVDHERLDRVEQEEDHRRPHGHEEQARAPQAVLPLHESRDFEILLDKLAIHGVTARQGTYQICTSLPNYHRGDGVPRPVEKMKK
jgi:hypothetical protein